MATATASTPASGAAASGHKAKARPERGKTKLDRIEAKIKKNAHAAGKNIARHLHAFEKTNATHVARAKREIKADVAKVRKATADLGDKFNKNKK
jgi:hypothetical protein